MAVEKCMKIGSSTNIVCSCILITEAHVRPLLRPSFACPTPVFVYRQLSTLLFFYRIANYNFNAIQEKMYSLRFSSLDSASTAKLYHREETTFRAFIHQTFNLIKSDGREDLDLHILGGFCGL